MTVNRTVGGRRTCSGLSDLGRRQVERLAARLVATGELHADVLYSSDFRRAVETAELLAPALGHLSVTVESGFGEHDPGPECDGLTFDEFVERYGVPDWESDPHGVSFPGGETVAEFQHRVGATVARAVIGHPGRTIVVACHGGVIDTVLRQALRTPPTGTFELHTANASLTELVLVAPGRWRLVRYNDAAHLNGLA